MANSSNPKPKTRRARSAGVVSLVALLSLAAPATASADFFFRPFGYAFHRPIPEPAPNVSPRAIAEILDDEGFRLVGALGRRGDQVVATGVDRRGRYRRFLIDPYEEEILRSWRIEPEAVRDAPGFADAPSAAYGGQPRPEPYAAPRGAQDPLVVPGLGGAEAGRPAPRSAAPSHRAGTSQAHAAARPESAETQRIPHSPPSQATKPPARPTPTQSAAPPGHEKAVPKPAAVKPADRKAPAQQQSGPTPPAAAPAPAQPNRTASEPNASPPSQQAAPPTAPEPAVGHQQAAPASQTVVPAAEPERSPPPTPAPANPVSADQSKSPPSGDAPKPAPGS